MLTKRALIYALGTFLAIRILTTLIVFMTGVVIQPNLPPAPWDPNVVQDLQQRGYLIRTLVLPWYRWDTVHYLQIATLGYAANLQNTVWPPLYPALISLFNSIFQPAMLASLVVTNLAAIAALFVLYLLITDTWGEARARRVVIWTAIFPTGFFMLAGYTESLFLLFAAACLLATRQHKWWLAGLMGALATMTRIPGVFLAVPILWEGWSAFRTWPEKERIRKAIPILAATALLPASLIIFGLYVHLVLKADWPWTTLSSDWHLHFALPWTGVIGTLKLMAKEPVTLNSVSQFLDVFLAIWAVILLFYGLRRNPFTFSLYSAVLLLPALMKILDNNTLMSLSRYLLPIFPLFVSLDEILRTRAARVFCAVLFLAGQGLLVYMFYKWVWVA